MIPTVFPENARSWRLIGTFVGLALTSLCGGFVMLISSSPSRALASTNDAGADPSFGTAIPSDRFVQSFQQQVSQQLQSVLEQSDHVQADRLHQFEEQQASLREQVQALQQGIANGRNIRSPFSDIPSSNAEPPTVHSRQVVNNAHHDPFPVSGESSAYPNVSVSSITHTNAQPVTDANIAPHGFIEGRLLNGVVAVVGGADRESIVALHGPYQSANGFTSQLDGCLALVQGKPELATGRIDFKLSRLTCNFPDGASRTWDTAGWLVDADGIRGIRAAIIENLSKRAVVSAGTGAISALGQRLAQEQYQVNSMASASGTGTMSLFNGNAGADIAGGAVNGAASSINQSMTEYYNQFAPSLQIGGGTPVTVVLANDLRVPSSGRSLTPTHLAQP
jgi:conjugal transfer pilus assembly protein TraB